MYSRNHPVFRHQQGVRVQSGRVRSYDCIEEVVQEPVISVVSLIDWIISLVEHRILRPDDWVTDPKSAT